MQLHKRQISINVSWRCSKSACLQHIHSALNVHSFTCIHYIYIYVNASQIQHGTTLNFLNMKCSNRQNCTFAYKHMMTHSQLNHKSCFCKQIQLYRSMVSREYTHILARVCTHTQITAHTHNHNYFVIFLFNTLF